LSSRKRRLGRGVVGDVVDAVIGFKMIAARLVLRADAFHAPDEAHEHADLE